MLWGRAGTLTASSVAVAGTTRPGTAARRIATVGGPTTVTGTRASESVCSSARRRSSVVADGRRAFPFRGEPSQWTKPRVRPEQAWNFEHRLASYVSINMSAWAPRTSTRNSRNPNKRPMPSILTVKPALVLDLCDRVEMSFQLIEAGSFRMGSRGENPDEEPRHWMQFAKPFYLGTFPVTQQQFAQWRPEHENGFPNNPHHPAENMNWHEANQYCSWLTTTCRDHLPAGYAAGLPTEAQWEYACRAGTDTEYYTGDGEAALAAAGWYVGNSKSQTHPVGQLQGNDFGLYDMHGNVWEWCVDSYDRQAYRKRVNNTCDPFVDGASYADRVLRGGGWSYSPRYCRSACRFSRWPDFRYWIQSFRVCLFLGPCPGQAVRAEQASAGMATRDEAATPQRDRAASDFLDDFEESRFPPR